MDSAYEQRVIAIKRSLEGERPSVIYATLGHSSTWFFKWKLRYDLYGLEGLKDRSKAPKQQARHIPDTIETAIELIETFHANI